MSFHSEILDSNDLCPIGTKAQLLGMVLYYLRELEKQTENIASIIYPFCENYPQKTSLGIYRNS